MKIKSISAALCCIGISASMALAQTSSPTASPGSKDVLGSSGPNMGGTNSGAQTNSTYGGATNPKDAQATNISSHKTAGDASASASPTKKVKHHRKHQKESASPSATP